MSDQSKAPTPPLDRRSLTGAFDIIGDVHGCADELHALLDALGYGVDIGKGGDGQRVHTSAPRARRAFFVGDFVDRGPASPDVLRTVMALVEAGHAYAVIGNHDDRFLRLLKGNDVAMSHGLQGTVEQFAAESEAFRAQVLAFLEGLPHHAWVDEGRLAIAHAGIRAEMLGRASPRVRSFCLYGDTSGKLDAYGLPERYNWGAAHVGTPAVVYGHTPVPEAEWLNNTICIDTGCVYGNKLTALRWPEREIVSVPAAARHATPTRPLGLPPARPHSEQDSDPDSG